MRMILRSCLSSLVNALLGLTLYFRHRMWAISKVKYAIIIVTIVIAIAPTHSSRIVTDFSPQNFVPRFIGGVVEIWILP